MYACMHLQAAKGKKGREVLRREHSIVLGLPCEQIVSLVTVSCIYGQRQEHIRFMATGVG